VVRNDTTSDEDIRTLINNRQNGRRRGRGGTPRPNGSGANGNDRGNRIDNRARGNAPQLHEKYKALARDAQLAGDRVMTEYYLQFADHYFRVLSEGRARFEEQRRSRDDQGRDDYQQTGSDEQDDYDDEDEIGVDPRFDRQQQQPQSAQSHQSHSHQPQPQQRDERPRRNDRDDGRYERAARDDRPEPAPRQDRAPRDARDDGYRQDSPRQDGYRQEAQRLDRAPRDDRGDQRPRGERVANVQADDGDRPRRGRPTREAVALREAAAHRELVSPAEPVERIEIDRLPPALANDERIIDPVMGDDGEPPKRRRGRPRKIDSTAAPVEG
jgi:hypothetical protein